MPAERVTLDREAVVALLVEVYAVADVLEKIAGVCPTKLTRELTDKAERVAGGVLGEIEDGPGGEMVGPRVELWHAGEQKSRAFLGAFGRDDA